MILFFQNGEQVRGDVLIKAALRTDLAPIPVTLEAVLRADESVLAWTREGMTLATAQGDELKIISRKPIKGGTVKGDRLEMAVELVAFLAPCVPASYVLERPVALENQTLHTIYRAIGAKLRPIASDAAVPRFVCMRGHTPAFYISRAVQEAGGALRWKHGRLEFLRLQDMMRQEPSITIPDSATKDLESAFLERHEAPAFYTLDDAGGVIHSNVPQARASCYTPRKSQAMLNSMGRVLIRRKEARIDFSAQLCAGDVVAVAGAGPLAIITGCHYFSSGTEGGGGQQAFTKLWLGSVI